MADEPRRHRIEVTCPECGHVQKEPALVVSTQCRSCCANFQVREGKGVVRKRPNILIAKPKKDDEQELEPKSAKTTPTVAEAQSSQCPKCSSYISLIDYEITEPWNRRIQTCGDVIIQKPGSVSGVTLQCHNLIVLGELAGSVECSGDLIIRSHGKIVGKVTCRNLRIEKGARVEFLNPVKAATAYIDGHVRGQISCTGSITLEKRAHLQGLVRTTSLVVKPGAKHSGTIEMVQAPPN
jgi:cytoskeletal protein CcmA (bactofilin family)